MIKIKWEKFYTQEASYIPITFLGLSHTSPPDDFLLKQAV